MEMAASDDAKELTQNLRELVNDWPLDVAATIRELFTFEDVAVLEVLIGSARERVANREYPSVTQQ